MNAAQLLRSLAILALGTGVVVAVPPPVFAQGVINTVIATGVVGNGAVLFTTFGAASHGYKVIVPVDTMPGTSAYAEQNAIWNLANDPGLGPRAGVTLTSSHMIQF